MFLYVSAKIVSFSAILNTILHGYYRILDELVTEENT